MLPTNCHESEAVLDALGNPVRREIVRILSQQGSSVGEIAARLPVSRPAVSKHLRLLEQARLVAHERHGTRNLFRLERSGFESARQWLESFWDEGLRTFALLANEDKE